MAWWSRDKESKKKADLKKRSVPSGLFQKCEECGATVDDIAEMVGAKFEDVDACLKRLEQAKLFLRDADSLVIAEVGKLDQFLEFLEMKENFGG